jgi:glucoamylase
LAAGHDVRPYIKALEGFSSQGGMLPEQIWDAPDIPQVGLKLGKFSGAAMPLVWAHAEYVKLLRSVTDRKVFDSISSVEHRYSQAKRPAPVEVFRLNRQLHSIIAGRKLRVLADEHFTVIWTADLETDAEKDGKLIFTLRWRLNERWEGRNFEVWLRPV